MWGFGVGAIVIAIGAFSFVRDRQNRALHAVPDVPRAIASGRQREVEEELRQVLARAVSIERRWLFGSVLGRLLIGEGRFDEARTVLEPDDSNLPHYVRLLADFSRHELAAETFPDSAFAAEARSRLAFLAERS